MFKILLVTMQEGRFSALGSALEERQDVALTWVDSGNRALKRITEESPDLLIVDEKLEDMSGLELVGKVLRVNARINSAVASTLSPEQFNDAAEGLGVLARLPASPDADQADRLLARLKEVCGHQA